MMQPELSFPTQAPINIEKIKGQNRKLYDYLSTGKSITMFDAPGIGISYLNSRVSDLTNLAHIQIYRRFIKRGDVTCREYSMKPFNGD